MRTTWFDVGYDRGLSGQEPDYPENSFARASYRLGYEAGDWFKVCTEQGWPTTSREKAKAAAG